MPLSFVCTLGNAATKVNFSIQEVHNETAGLNFAIDHFILDNQKKKNYNRRVKYTFQGNFRSPTNLPLNSTNKNFTLSISFRKLLKAWLFQFSFRE